MLRLLALLSGWVLASSAALAETATCTSLPGVEALWAKPQTRFVIFGEYHGTTETPALFADAVCLASRNKPVIVALEMPVAHQSALDAYMGSDGSARARKALTASPLWPSGSDGRGSYAMLELIEQVRLLQRAGRPVRLASFVPASSGDRSFKQDYYELGMAHALTQIAYSDPKALIMVLVGNIHSSKGPFTGEFSLVPAAVHLPAAETISLNYAPTGGRAWNCQQTGCGSNSFPGSDKSPRGVVLHAAPRNGHDGAYSPGRPYTASPPVTPPAR